MDGSALDSLVVATLAEDLRARELPAIVTWHSPATLQTPDGPLGQTTTRHAAITLTGPRQSHASRSERPSTARP
jgi:hypothetical protein